MLPHDGNGLKIASQGTKTAHDDVGLFDTAEVAGPAQPAGWVERGIDRQVGEELLDANAHLVRLVLGLTGVIASIYLHAVTGFLECTGAICTEGHCVRTNQGSNTSVLMDHHFSLSGDILLKALQDTVVLRPERRRGQDSEDGE